jgi:hypothetical protein
MISKFLLMKKRAIPVPNKTLSIIRSTIKFMRSKSRAQKGINKKRIVSGIRGTIGPMIGYWTAAQVGATMTGWISCGLMIRATIMLLPEIKHGRKKMLEAP